MKTYTGIPASPGIAVATAFVFKDGDIPEIPRFNIKETEVDAEWEKLLKAVALASSQINELCEKAKKEISPEQADIFNAHLLMLEDFDFLDQLKDQLKKSLRNIEWVVWDVSGEVRRKIMQSSDPNLRERAVDVTDVARRVISNLLPATKSRLSPAELETDVILVARNLMPSDTLLLNKTRVKGIALDEGSKNSHTAILARAFGIPAVLGLLSASNEINDGETLTLNGTTGMVTVNPDEQTMARHKNEEKQQFEQAVCFAALKNLPAETTDGRRVTLKANIGIPEEAVNAINSGAEGIGLYRTEFLFLTPGKAADEETQYNAYSGVIKTMGTLPVTIRTFDLGGDKIVSEFQSGNDKNLMLRQRAIRLSLANPEFFKVQLRAVLRAGVHGNARIMFPMISGIEEMEQACSLFEEARTECKKKKQAVAENIEVGVMIEVPSAAITADILAEKAGFFSIGSNDLIQYSLAADRNDEKTSGFAEAYHPAVLRFLKMIIDKAHEKGIKAGMCGELAGDPSATALLLGLGLDEFSMTASSIPQIKQIIRGASMESCKALAGECLKGKSIAEIRKTVQTWNLSKT